MGTVVRQDERDVPALTRLQPRWGDLLGEANLIAEWIGEDPLHIDRDWRNRTLGHSRGGTVDEEQDGREQTDPKRHPGECGETASGVAT